MRQIQRCHLLLFADTSCGSVFSAFVLAGLFAHNVVMFQYDASSFSISKRHLENTKQTSYISKTLTKLLKHVKVNDTKQTSQTSQRHGTNILNTSNCVVKGSHAYFMMKLTF
jgi:hypothetical protein